jgi:hypothetical protein
MASIDLRMALPTAVRRPVSRLWMVSASTSLSAVGGCTISAKPAKATMPISVPGGWLSMNFRAASLAACRRLGAMSVEHMLRDTSMARMIEVWLVGTAITAMGRATARITLVSATSSRAKGTCRRHSDCLGNAARTSDRLEKRTLTRRRRRCIHQ